jgi:sugar lactone lactonase YvrE
VPYTSDARSIAVGDDDVIYAAIGGEYAADNRILRIDNAGVTTTIVGPGTALSADPRWRLRYPDALTLDHRGGLAFIDAASNAVLRLDLASGRLERLSFTFKSASDLAADADGNLYVADRDARAVVRIDRDHRTARRVADVGGAKEELGFTDGVLMAEEPPYTSCSNDDVPGAMEIEVVVDNAPFEAATVYRVDGERNILRKTDASGVASFEIAESGRYVFLIDTPGFVTSVIDYRLSRSCTARIRVSPKWLHAF